MKALNYLWLVVFIPARLIRAPFFWARQPNFKAWDAKLMDSVLVLSFGLAVWVHWSFIFLFLAPMLLTISYLWGKESKQKS